MTQALDREEKETVNQTSVTCEPNPCAEMSTNSHCFFFQYILVVFAKDNYDNEVDPPMEIVVQVEDLNDNKPVCELEESVFEVQEDEPPGKI